MNIGKGITSCEVMEGLTTIKNPLKKGRRVKCEPWEHPGGLLTKDMIIRIYDFDTFMDTAPGGDTFTHMKSRIRILLKGDNNVSSIYQTSAIRIMLFANRDAIIDRNTNANIPNFARNLVYN